LYQEDHKKMRRIFAIVIVLIGLRPLTSKASATVTLEKGCVIRIEGEPFEVGEEVYLQKEVKGELKKLGVAKIAKKKRNKSFARVISGKSRCGKFKGSQVVAKGSEGSGEDGQPSLRKGQVTGYFGIQSVGLKGMHQKPEEANKSLSLLAFGLAADLYPLAFSKPGVLQNGLGLQLQWISARAVPEIEVASPTGDASENAKQQTVSSTLIVGVGFRYLAVSHRSETIGWILPVWQHTLTSVLTKTTVLTRAPLRNTSFSAFGLGLQQNYRVGAQVELKSSFGIGLGVTGNADIASEQDSEVILDKVTSPSALLFDLQGHYLIKPFLSIGAGFRFENYGGNITLTDALPVKISETYLNFLLALTAKF
jgi:hypothetical protein